MSPKTTRREFLKGTAVLTGGALLAACAPQATPMPEEPTAKPAEPTAKPAEPTAKPPEPTAVPEEEGIKDVPREKTFINGYWYYEGELREWDIYTPFCLGGDYQLGMNMIYEGMAYWNAFRDETYWWQAESAEYNDDNTELTINLRPEIEWSDGTPFTADDVVYTIQHLMDIGVEVRHGAEIQQYTKEVSALDAHTVLVKMNIPFPRYFWTFFNWKWDSGAFPIMPKHIFEGEDWSEFTHFDIEKGWPVTTGPLTVMFSSAQQKIFDRRDDWWAVKAGLTDQLPMERVINLSVGSDVSAAAQAIVSNEVDITELASDVVEDALAKNPKLTTHSGREKPYGYTDWWPQSLWVNQDVPPLGNADVRWAMSYYIDRDELIEVAWEGTTIKSALPFPPYAGLMKYQESIADLLAEYDTNEHNPEKGDARMEAAGFTKNGDGMWVDADGAVFEFEIQSWPSMNAAMQVVTEQLKRNGIAASFTTPPDAWDRYVQFDYTGFPAGHAGSLRDPFAALNLYKCPGEASYQVDNMSRWCNPDYDKIVLEMAETNPDEDEETMFRLFREAMELWLPALPDIQLTEWMHHFCMNETYWTNWPTVENTKDGEYVNEGSQLLAFFVVLTHVEPA